MVWDFYIQTGDGKTYLFHPTHSCKQVKMKELDKKRPPTPPPKGHEKLQLNLKRQYPLKGSAELTSDEKKMIAQKKTEKKKQAQDSLGRSHGALGRGHGAPGSAPSVSSCRFMSSLAVEVPQGQTFYSPAPLKAPKAKENQKVIRKHKN